MWRIKNYRLGFDPWGLVLFHDGGGIEFGSKTLTLIAFIDKYLAKIKRFQFIAVII